MSGRCREENHGTVSCELGGGLVWLLAKEVAHGPWDEAGESPSDLPAVPGSWPVQPTPPVGPLFPILLGIAMTDSDLFTSNPMADLRTCS
jgi:hypothetical protein